MPRYFEGERELPFSQIAVTSSQWSEQWLVRQLAQHEGKLSLAFRFDGFEADCIGYVFHIEQAGDGFNISDITRKQWLRRSSAREVVEMVLHVSGTRYSEDWQAEFHKLRNEIKSD